MARSMPCGVEDRAGVKWRSSQKDGIWSRDHHRGIQRPRRFPSSYTSGVARACYARGSVRAVMAVTFAIRNLPRPDPSYIRDNPESRGGNLIAAPALLRAQIPRSRAFLITHNLIK